MGAASPPALALITGQFGSRLDQTRAREHADVMADVADSLLGSPSVAMISAVGTAARVTPSRHTSAS